jgi:y4mF family transcriptional regulator
MTTGLNNVPLGNMDSKALGLIVLRERKAQKLRQAELAAAAGVGVRFIVDLEAGKPTLQLEKALHVLATLGCDVSIAPPAGNL